jgi:thiosulfate/3-mercaptopyruvate sulfurtransferase
MDYVVEAIWLKQHLNDDSVRIIDCRFKLGDPEAGRREYEDCHIPGAVYFDLEKDLSAPAEIHGGRHPLPAAAELKAKLETAGIDEGKTLVAYDAKEGAFASRFWWLLKYLGHDKVFILDGGFQDWTKAGYPVDNVIPAYEKSEFNPVINNEMLASYQEVKNAALKSDGTVLIDSRENKRYLGIEEPIDRIAGHIPKAINKPWMEVFENGFFRPQAEQEKRFSEIDKEQPIIVYCGSGVTATPNFAALKKAGYRNVKLYAGSYSDWVSYTENPVGKGNAGS